MPAAPADLTTVPESEFRHLADDQLIQLVATSRDDALAARALAAWEVLVVRSYDRVRGLVVAFRFPDQPNVRIHPNDYADATQECYFRARDMFKNFRGASLPEFNAALRTCVKNTCMDYCRRVLTVAKRTAGNIEDRLPGDDGESLGKFDADIARIAEQERDDEEAAREATDLLKRALPKLKNENMRTVLQLSMDGYQSKDIAGRLDTSIDNVDQLRSRGMKQLREALADEES